MFAARGRRSHSVGVDKPELPPQLPVDSLPETTVRSIVEILPGVLCGVGDFVENDRTNNVGSLLDQKTADLGVQPDPGVFGVGGSELVLPRNGRQIVPGKRNADSRSPLAPVEGGVK